MEQTRNMKMTPVGLIPEDWVVATIKDLGHLLSDGINPQQYREKDFVEYSMPAYDDGQSPTKCKGADMNSNRTQIKGEVLLFNKLNVRQKRVWYIENAPSNALCSMEFLAFSSNKVDLRLLREILLQDFVTKGFESVSRGTSNSQKRIAPSDFLNFSFALPPLEEQYRIAEALAGIDDMIGVLDEAIAKKRQIKDGLMQQLLSGKTRLPGFGREWREAELKEFGYMIRGVSYKPEDSSLKPEDGYVRLLRSNNIQEGKMVYADYVYVKSANVADYQYMKNGDILICMANGSKQLVGKAARLTRSGVYTFGAFMGVFRCNDNTVCPFVGELLKTGYYRKLLDDILTGSAINNLNGAAVESLKFFVPSDSQEQRAIADVLCKADDEINGLECQRDKYRLIKQGMMQELLTGKIRL